MDYLKAAEEIMEANSGVLLPYQDRRKALAESISAALKSAAQAAREQVGRALMEAGGMVDAAAFGNALVTMTEDDLIHAALMTIAEEIIAEQGGENADKDH